MNVVIIGTGKRALDLYIPVIQALKTTNLVGLCGKNYEKTKLLAKKFDVKPYKNFKEVIKDSDIDFIIIAVSWRENKDLYLALSQTEIPALIETPLGKDFTEVQEVFLALSQRKIYVDIAEQYHQRPIEQLKRLLIKKGFFGEIFYAFVDSAGHEYHGISLIRSYLGFDLELKKIAGIQKDISYFPHISYQNVFFPGERIQHALLEFNTGALAAYHWSWLSYESAIRSHRIEGFYGTKGFCAGEDCLIFQSTKKEASRIFFKRKTRVVEGIEVLSEIIAFLEDSPICYWRNPFSNLILAEEWIVAATFITNLLEGITHGTLPIYPLERAYQDHFMLHAMVNSMDDRYTWHKPL